MWVGGIQSLARAGFDPWLIALLSRHSSNAVFGYIRDAPLASSPSLSARAAQSLQWGTCLKSARGELQALVCAAQAEVRTAFKGDVDEAIAEVTSAAEAFFEEAASAARSDILRSSLAGRKEFEEAADLKLSTMWKVAAPCVAPPVPTGNCEPGILTRGQFVQNDGSGVWHLARDEVPGTFSLAWSIWCSWKHGTKAVTRANSLACNSMLCDKCRDLKAHAYPESSFD